MQQTQASEKQLQIEALRRGDITFITVPNTVHHTKDMVEYLDYLAPSESLKPVTKTADYFEYVLKG